MFFIRLCIAIAFISFFTVRASAESVLVGFSKVKTEEACPSAKSAHCAPILGGRLKLDKNPIVIAVPDMDSIYPYILGFYKASDLSGSYPGQCLSEPLDKSMIKEATIGSFKILYTANKTKNFGIGLDVPEALKASGLPNELVEKAKGSIRLAVSKIGDYKFETVANYRTYILDPEVISNLKGLNPNVKFKSCLDYIKKNNGAKLTLAVGGFLIDSSTGKTEIKRELNAGIAAALKKSGASDADILSFSTKIENVSNRIVETSLNPVFEGRAINYIDRSNLP